MKVILSRKGFDSGYGGGPSPIIDGMHIFSLPIPYKKEKKRRFSDLRADGASLGELIHQLYPHINKDEFCHLDPDIRPSILPNRKPSWRPIFGQADQAASHLINKGIGEGDLFMFFGLFRCSKGWKNFEHKARDQHVIFGWFQIDEVVHNPPAWVSHNTWASEHPHTYGDWWQNNNVIFLAKSELTFPKEITIKKTGISGAGLFESFDERLRLTNPLSDKVSEWHVPQCLMPDGNAKTISYIGNIDYWTEDGLYAHMKPGNTTKWQEAVISGNLDAVQWACDLIQNLS